MIRRISAVIAGSALFVLITAGPTLARESAVAFHDVLRGDIVRARKSLRPPRCEARWANFKHTAKDGHDHTMGPEHAGHHHGERQRNFKGYKLKPRCPTEFGDAGGAIRPFASGGEA